MPDLSWETIGPLIVEHGIELGPDGPNCWAAYVGSVWGGQERCGYEACGYGTTPILAVLAVVEKLNV